MIPQALADVTEAHLQELIAARAAESRHLEFKRELPEASDQGKVRFLRSVTAFANTAGGDLIYGMDTIDGMASALVPLALTSEDHVLLRLESLCATGVDPRLSGVQFRWVSLSQGGSVLIVRVPRSWNAPHRVTSSGHNHFYSRNSAAVSPMDVTELRRAFTLASGVVDRIHAFRSDRLMSIASGQGAMPLQPGAVGVLHVVPLQAFTSDFVIDVTSRSNALIQIHPIGVSGHNDRLNLDGRLAFRSDNEGRCFGYAQLFRSGIVEAATVHSAYNDQKVIASQSYEQDLLRALNSYFPALASMGVETPAHIFFSLLGVSGYRMGTSRSMYGAHHYTADRDVLNFPDVTVVDWQQDPVALMRPLFDTVWNAFGLAGSFNYNNAGEWVGQAR